VIAFGPVPSRRLGRSLGVNNIPPKICSYACAYCQLGRTIQMQAERSVFYDPQTTLRDVHDKVRQAREAGEPIDYLTFVPDGEPTLDIHLGHEIQLLRTLGIPIAVITNSSLIWREDVRADLMAADWVSLKVDCVREETWRRLNRPHGRLQLASILGGALQFAETFAGELATETMLVKGVNDSEEDIQEVAEFLALLEPAMAHLSIPTRPPAEDWVRAADEGVINRAYQVLTESVERVECLIGYEGNAFASTGNVQEDLLSITAVHPMREDALGQFLARAGADWPVVRQLVVRGQMVETEYEGNKFYLRRLRAGWGRTTDEEEQAA
jgi:wyosine [tRNA(Phe)-imidazoG37] synthetase (radical SAM superfamily)